MDTLKLPVPDGSMGSLSGYNFYVDWGYEINGEPQMSHFTDAKMIDANTAGAHFPSPAFPDTDTYTVRICGYDTNGNGYPGIEVNKLGTKGNAFDLISIEQWGNIKWQCMENAFNMAINLHLNTDGTKGPDLSNVKSMKNMFRVCGKLNKDLSHWDVSKVEDMSGLFYECYKFNNGGNPLAWTTTNADNMSEMFAFTHEFNQSLASFSTDKVTNMRRMFFVAKAFDQDISGFDITELVNAEQMLDDSGMSTENYDKLLNAWNGYNTSNVKFSATGVQYCDGEIARRELIDRAWGDGIEQMPETYSSDDGSGIDDGGSLASSEIKVNSFQTQACVSSTIRLDSLIQYEPLEGRTIKWSTTGNANTYSLADHWVGDVVALNYEVTEEHCNKDIKGKGTLYIKVEEDITLEDKRVEVCVYEANRVNLNAILGVAVEGKWTPLTSGLESYMDGSRFIGTAAYTNSNSTGAVEYKFKFEPTGNSCLTNSQAIITVIVTDNF